MERAEMTGHMRGMFLEWQGTKKRACVMDKSGKKKTKCGDGAGSVKGVNSEPMTCCLHWQVSLRSPDSPSPPGEGLCLNLVALGCISSPLHRLCPYFHPSIHPDCTSNGSSSQQPPVVMELCLNEQQQCPSTAPLFFSVSFSFFFLPLASSKTFFFIYIFILPQAVSIFNTPMYSIPQGHIKKWELEGYF